MTTPKNERRFEIVHVVGDRDAFAATLSETLDNIVAHTPGAKRLDVNRVSHAMAIDASGQIHWSAIIDADIVIAKTKTKTS